MVALGYGKHVRADRIYALVPFEGDDRGDGHRTQVWIEGVKEPVVASRSERAILADMDEIASGSPRGRGEPSPPQDPLF